MAPAPVHEEDLSRVELPTDAVEILRQLTGDSDRVQWAIGEVSAALVDELAGFYGKAPVRQRIAIETGLAPETVRDREAMARFYPEHVRQAYPALGYHQLRACKGAGERWEEYASWAVESADQYGGRPAPVVAIRARIKQNGDQDPGWVRKWERVIELMELLADDQELPELNREIVIKFLAWVGLGV